MVTVTEKKTQKKEKEIEITCREDVALLPKEEQLRWKIADELGLFDKVMDGGWKNLTSKETGRIGGIIASRRKRNCRKLL